MANHCTRSPVTLQIGQLFRLAGVDRDAWLNALGRNLLPEAPAGSQGRPRMFGIDDAICAKVFDEMLRFGLLAAYAACIATKLRRLMRQSSQIETIYVVRSGSSDIDLVLKLPPGSQALIALSIARYRAAIEAAFASVQ